MHADVTRLPANARGALFMQPSGVEAIDELEPGVTVYSGVPPTITAQSFSITSTRDPGTLPVQLTWIDIFGSASATPPRAFRFARKADQAKFIATRMGNWKTLLASGALVDISADLSKTGRVLRVGPVGGFVPGTRYTITYLGKSGDWTYPTAVVHVIDAVPAAPGAAYRLVLDAPPCGASCPFLRARAMGLPRLLSCRIFTMLFPNPISPTRRQRFTFRK